MRNKYVVTIIIMYHLRIINEIRDTLQLECTRLSYTIFMNLHSQAIHF